MGSHRKNVVILVFPKVSGNVVLKVMPFGILFVAACLRRSGFDARIFDLNCESEDRLIDTIKTDSKSICYIGFSVFTGPMIQDALILCGKIKKISPSLLIVWGGPHPTIMPELTVLHPSIDIVCCGEGENTAVAIAATVEGGGSFEDVAGIVFKRGNKVVFTQPVKLIDIKAADTDISLDLKNIDVRKYIFLNKGRRTSVFLTSRGCPYRCRFCWNLMFHKRRYMAWSPEKVMDELEPLINHKVEKILIFDSFIGSHKRVQKLGTYFRNAGIEWAIEDGCRVDHHSSKDFFRMLEELGCSHVAFGAESGSQRILDHLNKDITVDDILKSAESRAGTRIFGRYQWMTGVPGEKREDTFRTLDTIEKIDKLNPFSAHSLELYMPYPGNELFELACQSGWTPPVDLEGWGTYRWQGRYPYHVEGTWFFKSVQYSNFFIQHAKLSNVSAFTENIKSIFKAANKLMFPFAYLRWRTRVFGFPIEYQTAELLRRILEK
jgi:anaerobic magnesium-protoporphyrin IX monomethyl ester cyclase